MKTRTDYLFMHEIREDYQNLIRNGQINSHDSVIFICPKHGEYEQRLYTHLRSGGCPKCNRTKSAIKNRRTDYDFIDEIREDYRTTVQNSEINCDEKIPFICDKHGEYWQSLIVHRKGHGCPYCGNEQMTIKKRRKEYPFMNDIHIDDRKKIENGEISNNEKVRFW